jgi:DMSO/TMAO reductase YedYZ molybdopterin-dependent catalytic subunit
MRVSHLLVTSALGLALLVGCSQPSGGPPQDVPRTGTIKLDGVEVSEYKGERLDSVEDFRENSIKGPQIVDRETYRLVVDGLVDRPAEYLYSEVTSGFPSYEKVMQLDCVEGWSAKVLWEGVLVREVIEASVAKPSANTVIFHAADGYSTSLPLTHFYDRDILMAYRMNDVTLPAERGFPFQLVAEDKWGYKWCKWIERIELSDDPEYRGYWESRGYSNSGDRDKPSRGD